MATACGSFIGNLDDEVDWRVWDYLTSSQKQQLESIVDNDDQTRAQMIQQLQQFANTLSGNAQVRF